MKLSLQGRRRAALLGQLLLTLAGAPGLSARDEPWVLPPGSDTLETVLVSATPVMGTGIPLDHVPSNVQTVRAADIEKDHADALTEALERHFASIALSDTEGNPFQQNLIARGFTASPVLGTPQGLAIYQNGVRINEAFGDIVLWDFVPLFAIAQLQEIPGSNPVFGLNALGGAVTLQMKNGFDFHDGAADLSGGSFGRYRATLQGGMNSGNAALYFGAMGFHENGWRQHSSSDVAQVFTDAALRGDSYNLGASLTLAWSHLNGNGANPAEVDPAAAFAVPDLQIDRLAFLQLRGGMALTEDLSLQGTAYARQADIEIQNGAASGFRPCGNTVCDDSGPLTLLDGTAVPSGSPYQGILPVSTTKTTGLGGSLQLTLDHSIAGRSNVANLGASFDHGSSRFSNATYLGSLVYLSPPGTTTSSDGMQLGGSVYNVRLDAVNRYYGVFFSDTLSLMDALSITATGRFNRAQVDLSDLFGDSLNGKHAYQRFNPSLGATYQISPGLNVYASYSEANRIPTAAELSCANPAQPCTFPLGFVSDPDLQQVIAHTVELGARGRKASGGDLSLDWFADIYGTRNDNDIVFVSSGPLVASGYFTNAGATQRLGAEAALQGSWHRLDFRANYGFVRATFQSHLTILSDRNPGADANGNIFVQPGDRIPSVPLHMLKLGVGVSLPQRIHIGLEGIFVSSQYLRGDEANLQKPLPGYALLNARFSWQMTPAIGVYFEGENLLDRRYAGFGLYGDPTGNGAFPQFSDPRFYTPAEPFGFRAGVQVRF
ncbi:MAG: TonB-dependent receptor [Gammaproteobacteria bacterium]|nr:TonB-dependent receptor [Gammaproteobacteria bacterium]